MFGCTLSVVFFTPRSAYLGVSVDDPSLLFGSGSGSADLVTVATFVWDGGIVLTAGAKTLAVIVSVLAFAPPAATVPTVHTPVAGS